MSSSSSTNTEPAVTLGLVSTAVTSVLALLVAFGVDLTQPQQVAILGVVAGVGPIVVAILIRRKVTASASVLVQLDGKTGEVVAGDASPVPSGMILEPGATIEDVTP